MSLQVWLPLNGDLNNYGLNGAAAIIQNGTLSIVAGKIGTAYQFGTAANDITISKEAMTKFTTEASFCFWLKILTWNTSYATFFQAGTASTAWAAYRFSLLRNNANSTCCFTISNGSTASNASYLTPTLELDTWYHIGLVYKTGHCIIYINGQLYRDYTTSIVPDFAGITTIKLGRCTNGSSYQTNCCMNDVRIYDHALSAKEVKEIAKGLVLHYKLNDKYTESTQNLITTADCLSSTCYNGATSKYSYGTTTNMYKEVTTFDGHHGTKVYMGTNGDPAFPYVYVNGMFTSDGTNQPAYKTLSFDYYSNISTSIRAYKLGSGNGTATYRLTNSNGISTGTGNNAVSIPIIPNEWNHVEITFHGTTAANSEWGYIQNYPSHTSNTNNFWFFSNMQLETKDHATGYAGVGGIRSNNIVYDSSGYQYNATLIGETTIRAGDSARYDAATHFNGTNSCIRVPFNEICPDNIFTINLWFKKDALGSKNYETLFGGPSGFEMDTRAGSSSTLTLYMASTRGGNVFSSFSFSQWYMVTMVRDGTNELYYVNGDLKKTIAAKPMPTGIYRIGAWNGDTGQNYYGEISDFRIYNNVLSAEDIKELYNTSVSVDNKSNIYAREVIEI